MAGTQRFRLPLLLPTGTTADKSSQSPEWKLRCETENAVSTDTGSVRSRSVNTDVFLDHFDHCLVVNRFGNISIATGFESPFPIPR